MLILELMSLVLCVIVQFELLLILGFMILSLLVFMEVLLLTSLLGFPLLVIMFLLFLQIRRRQLIEFLVLVLWIEKKMWCEFQSLALVDLDL
jgi:hypothetical protein